MTYLWETSMQPLGGKRQKQDEKLKSLFSKVISLLKDR